jgi:hypothetical protein
VTTYLTTNKESERAARVVPFLGSLMQGVSAILFVFILAVGFNLASGGYQYQPLVRREDQRGAHRCIWCICHLPGAEKPATSPDGYLSHHAPSST